MELHQLFALGAYRASQGRKLPSRIRGLRYVISQFYLLCKTRKSLVVEKEIGQIHTVPLPVATLFPLTLNLYRFLTTGAEMTCAPRLDLAADTCHQNIPCELDLPDLIRGYCERSQGF